MKFSWVCDMPFCSGKMYTGDICVGQYYPSPVAGDNDFRMLLFLPGLDHKDIFFQYPTIQECQIRAEAVVAEWGKKFFNTHPSIAAKEDQ
jgi:hypothetical protein